MHPQVFFIVVHQSVVMTLAILGNLFLIFVIFRGNHVSRRRISPVQLLLLHTCVADLLFAVLSLGTEILTMISYPQFLGPDWVCKTMRYGQMFPLYASSFLLVAISADRYQAICRPLVNFRSSRYRRPNCLAAVAWFLALACSVPQFFIWGKKENEECATIYGREKHLLKNLYVIVFNTIAWLLPSIFAAFFYYRVCKAVWMSSSKPDLNLTSSKLEQKKSDITQDYIEKLRKKSYGFRRQSSEIDRKRVQTVRLTMTIIACNFFLWMPFCVVNVLEAFKPTMLSSSLIIYVMILGNLNSCVNPWIYILFNRSHVVKALCGSKNSGFNTHRSDTDLQCSCKKLNPARSSDTSISKVFIAGGQKSAITGSGETKAKVQRNVSFHSGTKTFPYDDLVGSSPKTKYLDREKSVFCRKSTQNGYEDPENLNENHPLNGFLTPPIESYKNSTPNATIVEKEQSNPLVPIWIN